MGKTTITEINSLEEKANITIGVLLFLSGFLFGLWVNTPNEIIKTNENITIINNTNYIIENCELQVLQKEFDLYKEYSKLEFDNYRACKDGMIK